jgi:hypothetical protein
MGEGKEDFVRILEPSKKFISLGEPSRRTAKDVESAWVNPVEKKNLRDAKNGTKQEGDLHCMLQEKVDHI